MFAVALLVGDILCFAGLAIRDGMRYAQGSAEGGAVSERVTYGCCTVVMALVTGVYGLILYDAFYQAAAGQSYSPGSVLLFSMWTLGIAALFHRVAK